MKVEGNNFTMYCGDAREVYKNLPQSQLIVSDPPYLLTKGGNGDPKYEGHIKMKGGWFEEYDNDGTVVECDIEWSEIAEIAFNSIEDGKHAYIMCNNRNVEEMLIQHREAGFSFHNLLVWDKRTMTANRWYMKNLEFIGFFYKKSSFTINNPSSKQLVNMPQKDESKHPTEKPVLLMEHYITNSSKVGETVFDPFAGSGTTGVAALKSGRKFIGIESDEKWFDVAVKRLTEAENTQFQESFI